MDESIRRRSKNEPQANATPAYRYASASRNPRLRNVVLPLPVRDRRTRKAQHPGAVYFECLTGLAAYPVGFRHAIRERVLDVRDILALGVRPDQRSNTSRHLYSSIPICLTLSGLSKWAVSPFRIMMAPAPRTAGLFPHNQAH